MAKLTAMLLDWATMAQITIEGVEELQAKLGKIAARSVLKRPMQRSVYRLQRYMANYPASSATSSYRRTGTLGRRWTTKVKETTSGLEGRIGNNTEYGPWVQSSRFQAGVHQGRWQTDEDSIKDNKRAITQDFQNAIDKALK